MEADLGNGVEREDSEGEGGIRFKHPDYPPDPSTERARRRLRGVCNELAGLVKELPGAVREFEVTGERAELERAREMKSLVVQNMGEMKRLGYRENVEESEEEWELLGRAEAELKQIGARLDSGGGMYQRSESDQIRAEDTEEVEEEDMLTTLFDTDIDNVIPDRTITSIPSDVLTTRSRSGFSVSSSSRDRIAAMNEANRKAREAVGRIEEERRRLEE